MAYHCLKKNTSPLCGFQFCSISTKPEKDMLRSYTWLTEFYPRSWNYHLKLHQSTKVWPISKDESVQATDKRPGLFHAISLTALCHGKIKLMQRLSSERRAAEIFRGLYCYLTLTVLNVFCFLLWVLIASFFPFVPANVLGFILGSVWAGFFVHSAPYPMVSLLMGDY